MPIDYEFYDYESFGLDPITTLELQLGRRIDVIDLVSDTESIPSTPTPTERVSRFSRAGTPYPRRRRYSYMYRIRQFPYGQIN